MTVKNKEEMKKDPIRLITCKEAEKSFNDLIDGYLTGKPKNELDHHLAHCRKCFGRIEFEHLLKEKIHSSASVNFPKSLRKKIAALLLNE